MYSNKSLILVAGGTATDCETILQAVGNEFHVVSAQTTADALGYSNQDVSLVICDMESPQIQGMELIRQWKSRQPHTPFITLICSENAGAAIDAMKSGVADCLVKPIDEDDLRSSAMELAHTHSEGGSTASSSSNGRDSQGAGRSRIDIPPGTSLEDLERAAVEQALVQHHGNRTHAARTLGISVRTLQRKLKAWGMPIISFPSAGTGGGFLMPVQATAPHIFSTHVH